MLQTNLIRSSEFYFLSVYLLNLSVERSFSIGEIIVASQVFRLPGVPSWRPSVLRHKITGLLPETVKRIQFLPIRALNLNHFLPFTLNQNNEK